MAPCVAKIPKVWVAASVCLACSTEASLPEPVPTSSGTTSAVVPSSSTSTAAPMPEPSVTSIPSVTPGSSGFDEPDSNAFGESSETDFAAVTSGEGASTELTETTASTDSSAGERAISELEEYLDLPHATRPPLEGQGFHSVPLTAAQSDAARSALWEDHARTLGETRAVEHAQKALMLGEFTLRYDYTVFGDAPADGRSLYISLHGGGEAEASVNDDQWENQKILYQPDEGIYLSPRAPTDTWNMWHQDHIDPLFERLIENFVALEGVNPNRVYVMGYSAGGDGVYQLGPRMADHWAAASAMAGHPNEAKPFSLRNIGFTIHVGGEDTAFDRNLVAVEWRDQLDALQAEDPMGYEHEVEVHAGKPHWMDLEDAVAVPWMAAFTRNPTPSRVVWYQDDILHGRFYWLRNRQPLKETTVTAEVIGQEVNIDGDAEGLAVMLRDGMVDLDQPVHVRVSGSTVHQGVVVRTIGNLHATLSERGDPALMFPAEVEIAR